MDEGTREKLVITSIEFQTSLIHVMEEGLERFGYYQTNRYLDIIEQSVLGLRSNSLYYPECRHLATKTRMYRNIILDSHLIIYRICEERIEVLDIVHAASSIRRIRKTRNIHID